MFVSRRVRSHENSFTNLDDCRPKSPNKETQINQFLFKTQECTAHHPINVKKLCPYYHDESDRRRDPNNHEYKCQLCPQAGKCPYGDKCQYSHNKVEQVYHPNRYKTKYCTHIKDCEYGFYCSFAHNDQELKLPVKLDGMVQDKNFWMFHYKTVWCPHIIKHDRGCCVYAHNAQDFRRDPNRIKPVECPHWNKTDQVLNYDQGGCPDQENCEYCHGWKEFEYHPLIYKTKPCTQINCTKKQGECAFYHNEQEKRYSCQNSRIRKQRPDQSWYIEESKHVEIKRQPYKYNSNYQGPIIPNYIPQDYMNKEKMSIGQPFELFCQQSITNTKTSESHSRRGSDFSDGSKMMKKKPHTQEFQKKHHGSAPVTPDQKQFHIKYTKNNVQLSNLPYSKKLYEEILKLNEGEYIYIILQGLKISEQWLMQMSDESIQQLNLSQSQINQLQHALNTIKQEKKYDEKCGDELLSLISNQGKQF